MIPKTSIEYSWIYNKQFNKKFTSKNLEELERKTRSFRALCNKHLLSILNRLEHYSGYEWKRSFIPIYIIKRETGSSLADPVTVKFHQNNRLMLVILIHELAHNLLEHQNNVKFSTGFIRENAINSLVKIVVIGKRFGKEINMMESYAKKKYKRSLEFDLLEKKLKDHLKTSPVSRLQKRRSR